MERAGHGLDTIEKYFHYCKCGERFVFMSDLKAHIEDASRAIAPVEGKMKPAQKGLFG